MDTRLGLCSAYSLLYGVHNHGALLDRAAAFGIKTVSVCDLNNLYGVHDFIEAAKERGIRPIIGTGLTKNKEQKTKNKEPGTYNKREEVVYCFVENRAGFSRLCEILTLRNKDKEHFDPLPHLLENAGGLVLASPDEGVLEKLSGRVKRLYAAISPADLGAVGAGRRLAIPFMFLDNSLFLESGDFAVHRVLRAIGLLKTVGNLGPDDTADKERILRSPKDLRRFLMSWPEAAKGTGEIVELCQFREIFDDWIFPSYGEDPAGQCPGEQSSGSELERRVYKGAELRYGELGEMEIGRIEYEMGIIRQKGFAPYFLRMDDIVKMSLLANGRHRTCGRGSGAASIVSYSLGITNVDPLRYNLYFERFLNPARPDPPDIDVDFAWDERDDLIKTVIETFGPDHCARVANHNMFRYRSALRETAKAYGFGDAEISGMERQIITGDKEGLMGNGNLRYPADTLLKEVFTIAKKIEGLPRGLSMHCGGLVITPEPISRYAPIEKSLEGFPLLAWEKEGAEAAGFVKIDLLGNRSLAVIRDAAANIKEQGIMNVDQTEDWEIESRLSRAVDDKETIEALARGDSIGVFYIESPAMRQLQKKTKRGDFEHIVIHSSLIRPAANKFIAEYVRRLKGGAWKPLHPRLENILDESYGILCYQEDVSKTAAALADFNEVDADKLRKVIAKKMGGAKLAVYENQFFEGCRKNGIDEETIKSIWAMMLSFDGYSFCKPHSASYAMVSFQSAYLRVHHPAEFMAAVLSNQGGYYRPHAYIAEARRMGLFTVGPDVNASRWRYYGKSINKACRDEVVIGLMAVKGLSVSGANAILKERDTGGEYKSLDDFSRRIQLNRDDIIALCPAGVFDSIAGGLPRHLQARKLLANNKYEIINNKYGNAQLFEEMPKTTIAPAVKKTDKADSDLWEEYKSLGFLRNLHPLALWKDEVLAVTHRVKALRIGEYVGQSVKMAGWPVTQKDVWTKDGLTMSFLSLEDETALYETVIFPQVYDRYSKLLFDQHPLLVYGKVADDNGAIALEIQRIEVLGKKSAGDFSCSMRLSIPQKI